MTDNTNDPVGVLRKVIHELRTYSPPADNYKGVHIHPCWAKEIEGALAAIQHSEQRETVPAGRAFEFRFQGEKISFDGNVYSLPATYRRLSPIAIELARRLHNSAPVAAPVPEAKAEQNSASNNSSMSGVEAKDEQVYQWLVRVSKCGMQNIEMSARDLMDYYEGAEPETAPAVKHEASELPPLPDLPDQLEEVMGYWVCEDCAGHGVVCELQSMGHFQPPEATMCGSCDGSGREKITVYVEEQMRAYGQACHALGRGAAVREYVDTGMFKAPPIAVQGSIADDAELDDICRAFHEAWSHDDRQAAENRLRTYIDSRSPVAAAPEKMPGSFTSAEALFAVIDAKDHAARDAAVRNAALEEAAKACQEAIDKHGIHSNFICINAIRALSAAAPSADAKADHD